MIKEKVLRIASKQLPLITLRSITLQDVNAEYVQWLNDAHVNQYLETRFYQQNLQSVSEFVANTINNPNEHLFTIRLASTNKHIGNIKVGAIDNNHSVGHISLFIGDKNYWGQGIAKQAIQLISRYSFNELSLRKLCANAYDVNIASIKSFLSSGYSHDGIWAEHYTLHGKPCDLVQVCMFTGQKDQLSEIIIEQEKN